jgi:ABC-2 type transport system permease protein
MDRLFLVFQVLTPVILTYLMGYSFGSYITEVNEIPYPLYLAAGMIVFNAIFTCQWLGHGIWDERRNGMYTQIRVMGFSEFHYLASGLLYNLIFALISMLVIIVAYPQLILYDPYSINLISIGLAIALLVMFYGSLSIIISLKSKSQVTFALINASIFEITAFTSSALYPPSQEIAIITSLNPLSYIVDLMRNGLLGIPINNIGLEIALIFALSIVMIFLAIRMIDQTSE